MSRIDFNGRVAIVTGAGGGWVEITRLNLRSVGLRWWSMIWVGRGREWARVNLLLIAS